jgi:hypothetical protein
MWPFGEMSLATATALGNFANILLVVSSAGVVIASALMWLTTDTKEAHWDRARETLQASVANANARAAEAELALARFRAPRVLTEDQKQLLIGKLKPFAGTPYDTGLASGDKEQEDFMWHFDKVLRDAGWNFAGWMSPVIGDALIRRPERGRSGSVAVKNVSLQMHQSNENKLKPAANALVEALKEIGIDAQIDVFNIHNMNEQCLHIMLGRKW